MDTGSWLDLNRNETINISRHRLCQKLLAKRSVHTLSLLNYLQAMADAHACANIPPSL